MRDEEARRGAKRRGAGAAGLAARAGAAGPLYERSVKVFGLLSAQVGVGLQVDGDDVTLLRAARREAEHAEGRGASCACREVKELGRVEGGELRRLGQPDDGRDLTREAHQRCLVEVGSREQLGGGQVGAQRASREQRRLLDGDDDVVRLSLEVLGKLEGDLGGREPLAHLVKGSHRE